MKSREGKKVQPGPSMYEEALTLDSDITRFDKLELNFKFKLKNTQDPFRDPKGKGNPKTHAFTAQTSTGWGVLDQLASYATEWCSWQHRTFAFTVCIFGSYARFIRWDRSGAVVSERFNYQEDSHLLSTFLWRFVHLKPKDRGRDTTVRDASQEEAEVAKVELKKWKYKNTRSPVVFTVEDDGINREFIGWGSMTVANSLMGRATRAYPVWDIKKKERRFLKDAWRDITLEAEANIIRELNKEGVRYVPTVLCGGDIQGHTTRSQEFAGNTEGLSTYRPWRCGQKDIVARIHHRLVVNFVGQHLNRFPSKFIMLQTVFYAYIGTGIHPANLSLNLTSSPTSTS